MPARKAPNKHPQIAERRRKVFDLRLRGTVFEDIPARVREHFAEQPGIVPPKYSAAHAYKDFQAYMEERKQFEAKDVMEHIKTDLARLERMIEALSDRVDNGETDAIESTRRLLERRAKLLGLDAPARVDHTTAGGPMIVEIEVVGRKMKPVDE